MHNKAKVLESSATALMFKWKLKPELKRTRKSFFDVTLSITKPIRVEHDQWLYASRMYLEKGTG